MPSLAARVFISWTYQMRSAMTRRTNVPTMAAIHLAVQGMSALLETAAHLMGTTSGESTRSGDRQRRGVDDFHVLGHGELEQLVLEAGVRQDRAEREGGHVPVHVVQLDPAQELGARVHFDDHARVVWPSVAEGQAQQRETALTLGSV